MGRADLSRTRTVLLIDPHTDTAELYDWALHAAGFEVCRTSFDRSRLVCCDPDLAIACMRQPDGRIVRDLLRGRRIPTILLTAWSEKGTTADDVDCDVLMTIPVGPTELVAKVRELLSASLQSAS